MGQQLQSRLGQGPVEALERYNIGNCPQSDKIESVTQVGLANRLPVTKIPEVFSQRDRTAKMPPRHRGDCRKENRNLGGME